jgi:hypothetical protein
MKLHNSKLRPLIAAPMTLLLVNLFCPSVSWSHPGHHHRATNTTDVNAASSTQKANASNIAQPTAGTSAPNNTKTNASQHKK